MRALKNKLTLVVLAVIAFMAFGMGVVFMPKTAMAEVNKDNGFYIEDGASVRTEVGQSGIKWTAHLTAAGKDFVIGDSGAEITQIGIVIKPSAKADSFAIEYPCEGVNLQFSETKTEIVYSYAIYYDKLYEDLTTAYPEMEHNDKLALVDQAYTTNLEAKPYVKLSNGETVYGDVYDTSRSIRGLALYFLLDGRYAGKTEETTLLSYMPSGKFNLVEERANNDDSLNYYSVVDNAGLVRLTDIPVDNATRAYIGAKDITSMIDVNAGVINLAGIEGTPGQDYTVSVLCSNGDVYNVDFTYATLAIDEASDLSYFKLKAPVDFGKTQAYFFTWSDPNDFVWDGYYMLLNNIDASDYGTHNVANDFLVGSDGKVTNFSRQQAHQMDVYNNGLSDGSFNYSHGFMGTFDGRGYTISNLKTANTGLFGIVASGTIKNVGFVNSGNLNYSLIAERVIGFSKFDNVFISTPTGTSHYAYSAVSADIGSLATFNNVMIIDNTSVITTSYDWSRTVGALSSSYYRTNLVSYKEPALTFGKGWGGNTPENINTFDSLYVVATIGLSGSIPAKQANAYTITMDAQYLDGVEQTGSIPYVQGAKRYTSIEKMGEDKKANDFSDWSSDMWTIVNGVPYMTSTLSSSALSIMVNGSPANIVGVGDESTINLFYDGKQVDSNATLAVVSGNASINGNVITADAKGTIIISAQVNGLSKQFELEAVNPIVDYEGEPVTFSALDGDFDFANVVGEGQISKIETSEGLELDFDVANNKIYGLPTRGDAVTEVSLLIYLDTITLRVPLNAYTLIIDEVSDLAYFHVTNFKTHGGGNYVFADGEAEFNGYYILAKDIDANGYTHDFNRGETSWAPTSAGYLFFENASNKTAIDDMGLTGTFDGNGYAIKNLTITEAGGLFGFINGGTVKNVAFINFTPKAANSGVLCAYMTAGSKLLDTYWYTTQTGNGGWNTQFIMLGAHSGAVLERNVFNWDRKTSSGNYYTGAASGILTEYIANPTIRDFYDINHSPISYSAATTYTFTSPDGTTSDKNVRRITADARYVDGVERAATDEVFIETWAWGSRYYLSDYTSVGTMTSPYSITLVDGFKRYTSVDKMKADKANNDFSAWSTDIWTVVDGYPQFKSQVNVAGEISFSFGENALAAEVNEIEKGSNVKVTTNIGAVQYSNAIPTIEIVSGQDKISVAGNVITALALGEAVVKVTYGSTVATATITVTKSVREYATELQLSAHDGVLFDGQNVVDIEAVVGNEEILSITDAEGNALSIDENGNIIGVTSTAEEWVANALIIELAEEFIQVNVKTATLIMDEKEDFEYFTIKLPWHYSVTTTYAYTFGILETGADGKATKIDANDFNWEGYYVLAKNIDATGYTHDLDQGLGNRSTLDAFTGSRMDYLAGDGSEKRGFSGTFDGQGYTISNLTTDANGLLGIVRTGAIKNLGMINCNSSNGYAPMAYAIIESSKIENVFVSTPAMHNVASHQVPFIANWGSTIYKVKNFVTIDNRIMDKVFNFAISGGSLTGNAHRDAAGQAATFGTSSTNVVPLDNVIIVSSVALSYRLTNNQLPGEGTVGMDAKYIDGVLNTATYTNNNAATCNPIEGARRYTSQKTLTADAGNITAQLDQLVATGLFVVNNGVITWKNAPVA